jgi:hypothetical protein
LASSNVHGWAKKMLQIRKLSEDDKTIIAPWYAHKGDAPVVDWLPIGSSFLLSFDSIPVACGSLLLTNSGICFMEHLATNHTVKEFTQAKALRFLAIELEKVAKSLGFKVILGLVPEDHFSLVEFYKRQGALLGSKLMRVTYKYL